MALVEKVRGRINDSKSSALLAQEREHLLPLPHARLPEYTTHTATVRQWSTIHFARRVYSVPSRLIAREVEIRQVSRAHRGLLPRPHQADGHDAAHPRRPLPPGRLPARHLVARPQAGARLRATGFREELFPSLVFRRAYDALVDARGERADVEYVRILHLAASTMQSDVEKVLETFCSGAGSNRTSSRSRRSPRPGEADRPRGVHPPARPVRLRPPHRGRRLVTDFTLDMGTRLRELCASFRLPTFATEVVRRLTDAGHETALPTLLEVFEAESRRARPATHRKAPQGFAPAARQDTRNVRPRQGSPPRLREARRARHGRVPRPGAQRPLLRPARPGEDARRRRTRPTPWRAAGTPSSSRQPSAWSRNCSRPSETSTCPVRSGRLDAFELLILDDIGYVQQSADEVEVLFTLMAERYERHAPSSSPATSSSATGTGFFKNPMTTAAAIRPPRSPLGHPRILGTQQARRRCRVPLEEDHDRRNHMTTTTGATATTTHDNYPTHAPRAARVAGPRGLARPLALPLEDPALRKTVAPPGGGNVGATHLAPLYLILRTRENER